MVPPLDAGAVPQVEHAWGETEVDAVTEDAGLAGGLPVVVLAGCSCPTTAGASTTDCSIVLLLKSFLSQKLAGESYPSVERGGAFLATSAGLESHGVGRSFYDIAETDFIFDQEARQSHAVRGMI
jgi:hypothetical protein